MGRYLRGRYSSGSTVIYTIYYYIILYSIITALANSIYFIINDANYCMLCVRSLLLYKCIFFHSCFTTPLNYTNHIVILLLWPLKVGPDLLVLGEQPRGKGLAVSLLERLEKYYQQIGGVATQYISTLVTNYRCHRDILNIVQNLFYASNLKCAAPDDSTHPLSSFSLHFVCSSITPPPHSSENPVNNLEADVVVDQLLRFTPGWPQDRWGKFDPLDICLISPSRSQVSFWYFYGIIQFTTPFHILYRQTS